MKKYISILIRLAVTTGLLFFVFKRVPYQDLMDICKQANKTYLFLGFSTFLLMYVLGVMRWKFFLRSLGLDIPYSRLTLSFVSSLFFNLFFPSIVAGDVFRTTSIGIANKELKKAGASVLMDRFSGSFAMLIIAGVSYALGFKLLPLKSVGLAILFMITVIGGSALVIFSRRIFHFLISCLKKDSKLRQKIIDFHDQLYFFRENPKIFLQSFFFSIPIQLTAPVAFYILVKGFGLNDVNILHFFILVPILMAVSLVPITIAGLGLRENAAVFFFSLISINPQISTSLSLMSGAVMIFTGLVGGLFYVTVYHRCFQSDS